MMRGDRLVIVVGGVLLAVVAGSAALALRFTGGSRTADGGQLVEVVHREHVAVTNAEAQAIEEPSFDHYRVVTEQDVFRPLLSPPQPEVVLAVPAEIPAPTITQGPAPRPAPNPTIDLAMTGVVESDSGLLALIKNIRSGRSVYAGVGHSAFGLRVAAIQAKRVTFTQGDETYTLTMGEKDIPEEGAEASARPATASRPATATAPSGGGGGEAPRPGSGPRPGFGFRGPGGDGSERFGGTRPGEGGGFAGGPRGGRGFGGGRGDGSGRGSGGGGRGPGGSGSGGR